VKENTNVKDFRVHDVRRTIATYLAKMGNNRTTTGKILMHKWMSDDNSITAIIRMKKKKEKL
jgi:hypothetical protein